MPESFDLETREFQFRAENVDTEKRTIKGIAVPFGKEANIGNAYVERFAPGSVQDSDNALFYWRHQEPIGKLISARDTKDGWEIEARISETTQGNDALTLARDGVVVQLSVGFEPGGDYDVEERDGDIPVITRTKVRVREVSQVPFGAYDSGAVISEVRSASSVSEKKGQDMSDENKNADELLEIREVVEELDRKFATFSVREEEPAADKRSAGAFLQALAKGDESTVAAYERALEHKHDELQVRAYTGGTTADAPVKDAWVGDLTRIFDNTSGVQSRLFKRAALPATGMTVEYAQLKSNTVKVEEQANQGDDLAYGKVELETKSAPVKTFGGYTQLSRQAIERSTLPVLNRTLEALTVEAGKRKKAILRTAVNEVITAREAVTSNGGVVTLGATLAAGAAGNWEDALVDAAIRYEAEGYPVEAMVVSASVFKKLRSLTVSGERVFQVWDRNASGFLNLPGLTGNLAGLPVYLDAGQTGDKAYFVNGNAITVYESGIASLQDENIINLSKDFSVYFYAAIAPEIPQLIVPVKFAAS